jgi:hypothetical protein
MNFATKVLIIVILVLKFVITALIDLAHEYYYPNFNDIKSEKDRDIYNKFQTAKLVLDIPFVILSIYLLLNIKFNPLILSFIVLQFVSMFEDYYLGQNIDNLNLDENTKYFLKSKFSKTIAFISLILGSIILYRLF